VFTGLGLTAGLAVQVVLGPKWEGATATLAWLSAAGFGFSITSVAAATLMGLGRSELQLRLALAAGALTVAAVAAASPFGVAVVGVAVAAVTLVMMLVYLVALGRALTVPLAVVARALAPAALGATAMAGVLWAAQGPLEGSPPLARLAAFAVLGTAVYAAVVAASAGRRLAADLRVFRG
jgi:O-antigen/teichoic acid export membrane protein